MTQRIGIVTTLKNPGNSFESFIRYHLDIGFDHMFLFFDDPKDKTIATAEKYARVTVIKNDKKLKEIWKKTVSYKTMSAHTDYETMSRQILNAEVAIRLARKKRLDWLLHIDSDELFYAFGQTIKAHFENLVNKNVRLAIYPNYEAITEKVVMDNCFKEVTLFKRNPWFDSTAFRNRKCLEYIKGIKQLPERYFLFYGNGKAAVKICENPLPSGVHSFTFNKETQIQCARRKNKFRDSNGEFTGERALILHYACCGFGNFWNKYITLGQFSDRWFDGAEISKYIGTFHIEARNAVMKRSKKEAMKFYKKRVVISDKTIINCLLNMNVACRIQEPSLLLSESRNIFA